VFYYQPQLICTTSCASVQGLSAAFFARSGGVNVSVSWATPQDSPEAR